MTWKAFQDTVFRNINMAFYWLKWWRWVLCFRTSCAKVSEFGKLSGACHNPFPFYQTDFLQKMNNRGHLWSSPLIMVSFWMLCKADNYFCNVIAKLHSAVVKGKSLMRWMWLWLSKNAHSLLGIFFSYERLEKLRWAAKGVRGAVSTKCDFSCFLWDSPLPQSWHRCTQEKERTWRPKRSSKLQRVRLQQPHWILAMRFDASLYWRETLDLNGAAWLCSCLA